MLTKLLVPIGNRKGTCILIAISFALMIAAIVVGVSNSIPGIILRYVAAIVLAIALTHTWQEVRKFLILLGASFVGFFVFVWLHIAFDSLGEIAGHVTVLSYLIEGFQAVFFFLVAFICPVFFAIGAVGGVMLFIKAGFPISNWGHRQALMVE